MTSPRNRQKLAQVAKLNVDLREEVSHIRSNDHYNEYSLVLNPTINNRPHKVESTRAINISHNQTVKREMPSERPFPVDFSLSHENSQHTVEKLENYDKPLNKAKICKESFRLKED